MKKWAAILSLACVAMVTALFTGAFSPLLSVSYLPHRFCYLAQPGLIWTNVSADSLIAISYGIIFVCLLGISLKLRHHNDVRGYLWIFVSFGMFILACGATHVMEVVTVWWPAYPLSAAVKVICVAASLPTAILFARATPTLAHRAGRYMEMFSEAEQERDEALSALISSKELAAERRRAELELPAAYDQVNSVLECTSDAVVKIDRNWMLVYGNRKAADILPDFFVGKNYWNCFPDVRGTPLEVTLVNAMQDQINATYEVFYERYQKWFRGNVFPTVDGLSIFFADITDEKALQEELEQSRYLKEKRIEALGHMAGGLAHEISNPLAIIHAKAHDLMQAASVAQVLPAENVRNVCESIVKTSDRATRILRGLKGFGRDAAKDPMETASIYEIVDECVELQGSRFERHKVELRLDLKQGLPYIDCRETQIGQIITNLLNNGFDAIVQSRREERWVVLAAERTDAWLNVEVTDSGPGIDEKVRAHLMEPFFTTKTVGLGMGIGLSLSRAIAIEHGGSLTLCANTPNTRFRLALPIPSEVQDTGHEEAQL